MSHESFGHGGVVTCLVHDCTSVYSGSTDETVRQVFFDGLIRDWQVVVPDFGTLEGPFQITALEYAGEHNGELTYEMALESGGAIAFTAA